MESEGAWVCRDRTPHRFLYLAKLFKPVNASRDRPNPDEMGKLASIGKGRGFAGIGPHNDSPGNLISITVKITKY